MSFVFKYEEPKEDKSEFDFNFSSVKQSEELVIDSNSSNETCEIVEYVSNNLSFVESLPLLKNRVGTWKTAFDKARGELQQIASILDDETQKFTHPVPNKNDTFKAFELTPLNEVKVVIIGQDPYPQINNGTPMAKGLSFSVDKDVAIPVSLNNIFKEIKMEYPEWNRPDNGDLTKWTKQGVLLLNSCLTCRPGESGSHSKYKLWLPFILKIIKEIEAVNPNCIYVMWGAQAQRMTEYLGDKTIKLEAAHPSGFSASRGFFKCGHFKSINDILIKNQKIPIEW